VSSEVGAPPATERRELVAAEDLEVRYQGGPQPAVTGVTVALGPGEGLLVAGAEASGKTSLLRGLLGLTPAGGSVRVLGAAPGDPAALRRVGYGPQGRDFPGLLTAGELLGALARLRGAPAGAVADALGRAGLPDGRRLRGAALGPEGARRLSLAAAVLGDPDLLVLDDPWEFPETLDAIAAARARGAAVIATTREPASLADALGRTLTLVDGRAA
jgi:ABC-type multidrug transport system ATPase subunit